MFQAPRGTQDALAEDIRYWTFVEHIARRCAALYGYLEIRTPTFEDTKLFTRGAGEATDVVEKEMYSFQDKGGNDLTLRAEGTAPIMRAYLEHGMGAQPQPIRLFSLIHVFRYDRPQAGRLREHSQLDCEAIGDDDPALDVEVVTLLWRFYEALGLSSLSLQLNSIGCPECRPAYIRSLATHYAGRDDELCADCRRRRERNPLRLLDCKVPSCQPIADSAPAFLDHLCAACAEHFSRVRAGLEGESIAAAINKRLVRGLDYYTRTVFEVWPPRAGGQASLGGGGRYDGLAEQLGGRHTPGVGFGTGLERLILNLREQGVDVPAAERPVAYVGHLSDYARPAAWSFAQALRGAGVPTVLGVGTRALRARLRNADAAGVRWAAIFGDNEVDSGTVALRDMGAEKPEILPVASGIERVVASLERAGT